MAAKTKTKIDVEINEQTGPADDIVHEVEIPVVEDKKTIKERKKKEKRDKKDKNKKETGGKKKPIAKIIVFSAVAVIFVGLVAVVGFDALGLRTKYLNGFLQNIPIVKNIVPAENTVEGEYAGWTQEELVNEIAFLKTEIESNEEAIEVLNQKSDIYVKEISRLEGFEQQQLDFKARQEEFDRMIASNDRNAYAKFYSSINPENAEVLYREAVLENRDTKKLNEYVSTFRDMSESESALILEELIGTDMDLVVLIVSNLESEFRASILGKMAPANAASITKMMLPQPAQAPEAVPLASTTQVQ